MFAIAPGHDLRSLATRYAARGRVQLRDFLEDDSSLRIEAVLKEQTPWGLCFNQGERVAGLRAADVAGLSGEKWRQITSTVAVGARDGFQFFYRYFPLFTDYFDAASPPVPLFGLFEFINSAPFLELVRHVTGHRDIVWADAHATCFEAGHFLMRHNDEMPGAHRRAAYVLNFTRDWRPDWGGYLQFFDSEGDVERAFKPLFNAINLFEVPRDHSVEAVSPFAGAARLSVTGWFRADQPPGPIGKR
jgi:SM-20-related protein